MNGETTLWYLSVKVMVKCVQTVCTAHCGPLHRLATLALQAFPLAGGWQNNTVVLYCENYCNLCAPCAQLMLKLVNSSMIGMAAVCLHLWDNYAFHCWNCSFRQFAHHTVVIWRVFSLATDKQAETEAHSGAVDRAAILPMSVLRAV